MANYGHYNVPPNPHGAILCTIHAILNINLTIMMTMTILSYPVSFLTINVDILVIFVTFLVTNLTLLVSVLTSWLIS